MIYLASDHQGFKLKDNIKNWMGEWGFEFEDLGPFEYDEKDDYPDFVHRAAEKVESNPDKHKAIIIGATGQGEAMVINRYPNIRAAVYYGGPHDIIVLSRNHNNANVLSLGAAFLDSDEAKLIIKLWLDTEFSGDERHVRRIKKIER